MNAPALRAIAACGLASCVSSLSAQSAWTAPDRTVYHARPGVIAVLPGDAATLEGEPLGFDGWRLVPTNGASVADAITRACADHADYAAPVFVGLDGGPLLPTRDLLIGVADDSPGPAAALSARVAAEAGRLGIDARISSPWPAFSVYRVTTDAVRGDDILALASVVASLPNVTFAEPDMLFTGGSSFIPNDTFFSDVWGIRNTGQSGGTADADMDGDLAWDTTIGDASIITVVFDVGVDQTHPDINQRPGADFMGSGANGGPGNACDQHGTPVAGCISARIHNNLGTVGIAPGTRTASARLFESNLNCGGGWSTYTSSTIDGLDFATSIGARVTNNSNYYGFGSVAIESAYNSTYNAGMVHFASAGNDNTNGVTYPSSLPTVNAVGAINRNGNKASFSNYGPDVFVTAPGQAVLSTDRQGSAGYVNGDYVFVNGTSFASPYAAGVAALVLSVDPTLTPAQVEDILASTADDYGSPGKDNTFGWGVVNANAAVAAVSAGPCSVADLAEPFGVLDLSDVTTFTSAFLAGGDAADVAPPFGLLDLTDVVLFVDSFVADCP